MAIPWTTIASAIPWSEVIARTPEVLRGARKLFQRAGSKGAEPASETLPSGAPEERIAALEARCREHEARAQEGADLLAQLAEQQSGLIAEVARLHRRSRRLLAAVVVLGMVLGASLSALLLR